MSKSNKLLDKFIFGTPDEDSLNGNNGNDIVFGFGGDDLIFAGRGNDLVFGGNGHDEIHGGKGNDDLYGENGNDGIAGDDGNDYLSGGNGRDFMVGGAGNDRLVGDAGPDTFVVRHGTGHDTIADLNRNDRIDLRDFNFTSQQAAHNAFHQQGHDAVLNLGGGDKLTIEDTLVSQLHDEQFIVSDVQTGPTSSASPYVIPVDPAISTASIMTVGDQPSDGTGWQMVGIPDGLGAFDNGDGTFTVLMNHELTPTDGVVRDHGSMGAFVSSLTIDKTTLEVVGGHDLIQTVHQFNAATDSYFTATATFNRFCSADLAEQSAFFNSDTGLGFSGGRLFLNGEESGTEGRAWAHIASGPDAGNSYELGWLGNMAFENVVANYGTGNTTVVGEMDDGQNGQVYFYFGQKQATGNAVDQAGLTHGSLYGLQISELNNAIDNNNEANSTNLGGDFQSTFALVNLGDVNDMSGVQIDAASETAGVTSFMRPEDGAWSTVDPDVFYFVSTNAFNAPSRLWEVHFNDATNPNAGGTIRMLLDGTEGQQMLDNIAVTQDGKILMCEDVGNNAFVGRILQYDPTTDQLTVLGQHDLDRFDPNAPVGGQSFLTQDEEASGIIDVTNILGSAGQHAYLFDTQAHFNIGGELVQGGQLQVMYQDII